MVDDIYRLTGRSPKSLQRRAARKAERRKEAGDRRPLDVIFLRMYRRIVAEQAEADQ